MILVDGSHGEGGGQILRSSLALSLVTGKAFRIQRVRAGRARPGLLRQHLTAVQAAAAIGDALVTGDRIGSMELTFEPRAIRAGEHRFAVGTAGSACLVMQSILPALLSAGEPSRLVLEGGTHNPTAPTFDFLAQSYLPLLASMGAPVLASLDRHGFYPTGGGRFDVRIPGTAKLGGLELDDPGEQGAWHAVAKVARLPLHIADRELAVLASELDLDEEELERVELPADQGPGNVCHVALEHERLTVLFTGFGEKGVPAEEVASEVVEGVERYAEALVAVDEHLADQLLLPMALGEGGSFTTTEPTRHALTHAEVIALFLERRVGFEELGPDRWRVVVA